MSQLADAIRANYPQGDSDLAKDIALEEGFGIPGAVPTRDNNPGDLRHSPHSEHPGDPNAIGVIDTPADGWADLEEQLERFAARNMTMAQMVAVYAPGNENNTAAYLQNLCDWLRCSPDTLVSEALKL